MRNVRVMTSAPAVYGPWWGEASEESLANMAASSLAEYPSSIAAMRVAMSEQPLVYRGYNYWENLCDERESGRSIKPVVRRLLLAWRSGDLLKLVFDVPGDESGYRWLYWKLEGIRLGMRLGF